MYKNLIIFIALTLTAGQLFGAEPQSRLDGNQSAGNERFFEVKAKKFSYTPNIIRVNKGDTVRIRLISEDVHHGLFVDAYNVKTSAYPGQDGSLQFTADKTGRFTFRCSTTCGEFHPYMVGVLIVEPNSRFSFFVILTAGIGLVSLLFVIIKKERQQTNGQQPQQPQG